jgi:transposase
MSNFRQFDRATGFLLPPSLDEWLPERHLARFVVEVIDGLDLSAMVKSYRGSGSAGYHPALLLGLLVYGYTTGVFSSRKLEWATYDSVAFRFIAANDHPDHDTIATFRRRFLKDIAALFVRVLELAREMGLLRMGTVGLDGTKIHANASRHSALSYKHAGKIEAQLKAEVADLLARAEDDDPGLRLDLTQVAAAFYHSLNANKAVLWKMAQIIEYRGYLLSVEPHAPGSKILIFPPDSSLPLPTILFQRNRTNLDGLVKDAKDIVDNHLAMSAKDDALKGAPSWWRHYRSQ